MKLLILYTKNRQEVFNKKSALGSYINYLGNLLEDNGFEVFLNGERLTEIKHQTVTAISSHSRFSFVKKLIPNFIKRYIKEKQHFKNLDLFYNELTNKHQKYDAILEYYNLGSNIGLKLSKAQNIPYYIFYDGPILDEYQFFNHSKPYFFKEVVKREKESFKYAKKIVAQSNPMKDYVIKNIINAPDKIVIHQNVDYTKFDVLQGEKKFNTDVLNIGFIGSFLPWHQVELLVNAFVFITKKGVKAKLFLIGDGMERQSIENYCQTLPDEIKQKITFTGFVTKKELHHLKSIIDIGVMSGSNWYGAPLKIFEYGAMKMACIAPDTPTIKDLFPNNEVTFFKWKSQDSLNDALLNLCQDIDKIKLNSKVLNQKVLDKYTPLNTINFYKNLINPQNSPLYY